MGRSQWENCEEFVINDGMGEIWGGEWGMAGDAMRETVEKRMNVNNEMYELYLKFVHVYKISIWSKKVLTKHWKILYTAFT